MSFLYLLVILFYCIFYFIYIYIYVCDFFILVNLMPNLIPNFIKKIEFESNFKVVELEFKLEPCDIDWKRRLVWGFLSLKDTSIFSLSSLYTNLRIIISRRRLLGSLPFGFSRIKMLVLLFCALSIF